MNNDEILDRIIEETKTFGRTQFIELLVKKQEKIEELAQKLYLCMPEIPQHTHGHYRDYADFLNDTYDKIELIKYLKHKIDICDGYLDTAKSDFEDIDYGGRIASKTYLANQILKNKTAKKCYEEILFKLVDFDQIEKAKCR